MVGCVVGSRAACILTLTTSSGVTSKQVTSDPIDPETIRVVRAGCAVAATAAAEAPLLVVGGCSSDAVSSLIAVIAVVGILIFLSSATSKASDGGLQ